MATGADDAGLLTRLPVTTKSELGSQRAMVTSSVASLSESRSEGPRACRTLRAPGASSRRESYVLGSTADLGRLGVCRVSVTGV